MVEMIILVSVILIILAVLLAVIAALLATSGKPGPSASTQHFSRTPAAPARSSRPTSGVPVIPAPKKISTADKEIEAARKDVGEAGMPAQRPSSTVDNAAAVSNTTPPAKSAPSTEGRHAHSNTTSDPPSGWYPDPDGSGGARWWDGAQWTTQRQQTSPPRVGQAGLRQPSETFGSKRRSSGRNAVGAAIVVCGVLLMLSAVGEWGSVREIGYSDGESIARTASFPGSGSAKVTYSNGDKMAAISDALALDNTEPGDIGIGCGLFIVIAGIVYLVRQVPSPSSIIAAMIAAVLGAVTSVITVGYILDMPGTFDNPAGWVTGDYSVGVGLLAACALSLMIMALGSTGVVMEWARLPESRRQLRLPAGPDRP